MASRHFSKDAANIRITMWLIFTDNGGARLTRDEPDLKTGERAMHVTASLPRAIFRRPSLTGTIIVPGDANATSVLAKVENNAAAVLKKHCGLDLTLTVKP
jgi:hypothetical protein